MLAAALLAITARAPAATNHITVPLKIQRGHLLATARVNGSEPLSFLLDTGYSVTTLHPDLVEPLGLRPAGRVTIVGIAGEEEAPMFAGAVYDLGGAIYKPRRVASLPSEWNRSRRRDGVLGSGFFRRFVVEVDGREKTLRLHEPTNFVYTGQGEILPLRFRKETPAVEAVIVYPDRPVLQAEFEIDTGCDSGLCLGQPFVERHRLLDSTNGRNSAKFGVGGGAQTRAGHVPRLRLGRWEVDEPSTDFFIEGSPVDAPLAGHIGMGVLRQFKLIFDYSRKQLILEK
jgi:predicted aspartyl protease